MIYTYVYIICYYNNVIANDIHNSLELMPYRYRGLTVFSTLKTLKRVTVNQNGLDCT